MTESFRSAVSLRNDICNSIDDLVQRFTAPLPDSATVYVTSLNASYRLAKGLGITFDALIGRVIIPSDGSSNRWVQEEVFGSSPWAASIAASTVPNVAAAGANVWAEFGSLPGVFQLTFGDTDMWTVNPTTGLLTYNGLPRFMLVTAIASLKTVTGNDISIVVSKDNDVPAGSTTAQPLKGEQFAHTADDWANIATQRMAFVAPGSTFRLMVRSFPGEDVMAFDSFTLTAMPI
jgi:hypothetical protein